MAISWDLESLTNNFHVKNSLIREWLAEFVATFLFLLIGTSANVQQTLNDDPVITSQIAWGIGFAFGVYLASDATGGHLNPAISFTLWLLDDLSFIRFIIYSVAQFAGAFCGAAIAFYGHYDDIKTMSDYFNDTTDIGYLFFTKPAKHISIWGAFSDQVIGTAILSSMIFLIIDEHRKISKTLQPLLAGFVMMVIAMCFGANCGFAINPARDLGPRLFLLIINGWTVFTNHTYYFWIPIAGPFIGAPLGAILFKLFIGLHETKDFNITGISYKYPHISSITSLEPIPPPILPQLQQQLFEQQEREQQQQQQQQLLRQLEERKANYYKSESLDVNLPRWLNA